MTARTRFVRAAAAGCVAVAAAGLVLRDLLHTGVWYPVRAAGVFAVLMAFVLRFIPPHPFDRIGAANWVTIGRAMLTALSAALVAEADAASLAWAAVAAGASSVVLDGVDGWLARRNRTASVFGARFDVETDALLIMVLSVLVWHHRKAGVWVLACGLMRYAFVAGGWLLPWLAGPLTPTRRGRAVAVMQAVGLGVALVPAVASPVSDMVAGVALGALTWSFALDIRRLWRQRRLGYREESR